MSHVIGNRHSRAARSQISASLRKAWAEGRRQPATGWRHSQRTKAKISATHRRKLIRDPGYRKMRREHAISLTRAARERFLRTLAVIALVDIPMRKADAARLRKFPCVLCLTTERPRELAHIQAR